MLLICILVTMDPIMESFLKEIASNVSSIDTTKRDVSEYDEVVQGSIKTPKYCLTYLNDTNNKKEDDRYNSDHDKDTKSDDHKYASGHSFDKFFEFYRCFPSKVTKMNRNVINDKIYCV